jgi:3-dehydroquinate synthase
MAAAAYLSHRRGLLTQEQLEDIMQVIQSFREPFRVNGIQADEVYEVTRLDKKMDSDRIRFILLKGTATPF